MMSSSLSKRFGSAIRRRRLEVGYSQERLAECARLHPTYISMVERATRNPTIDVAERIAKALSMTLWELIQESETR